MSSLKRKLSRRKGNKAKKLAEKEMATKISLFGQMPNECLTCQKSFDKTDKEQVMTWNVVVREQKEEVRLYCPNCWNIAMDLIKKAQELKEAKK